MLEDNKINLFETIVAPLQPFINEAAQTIKPDSETYKLSLVPFTQNLLFGVIDGIKTVGLLVTEIKTSPIAKKWDGSLLCDNRMSYLWIIMTA